MSKMENTLRKIDEWLVGKREKLKKKEENWWKLMKNEEMLKKIKEKLRKFKKIQENSRKLTITAPLNWVDCALQENGDRGKWRSISASQGTVRYTVI